MSIGGFIQKFARISKIKERRNLIIETHKKLMHRNMEATYYEMKKDVYWPAIKK